VLARLGLFGSVVCVIAIYGLLHGCI
jgi:hypothetical protein